MHLDIPVAAGDLLPLKDAIVLAPSTFWNDFPSQLLEDRVTIARSLDQLAGPPSDQTPAIIVLDDSDIQNHVMRLWEEESIRELIVVLLISSSDVVSLKSLARNLDLAGQLHSFSSKDGILALRFAKYVQTDWDLHKLLEAISILAPVAQLDEHSGLDPEVEHEIVAHLEVLEQLIALTATDKSEILETESLELEQLRDQNARLQSNNASLRIRAESLERKYNTLANSRLGRLTLKRWERK